MAWLLRFTLKLSSIMFRVQISSSSAVSPILLFVIGDAEFVGGITRHHKLRLNYVLFECKSQHFEFTWCGFVEATSGQTMQVVQDVASGHIKSVPKHGMGTGHYIEVYNVWGLDFLFGVLLMHHSPQKHLRRHTTKRPGTCVP